MNEKSLKGVQGSLKIINPVNVQGMTVNIKYLTEN